VCSWEQRSLSLGRILAGVCGKRDLTLQGRTGNPSVADNRHQEPHTSPLRSAELASNAIGGRTPEALVKGRERIYLDHFWNDFAADETKSIPEADRQLYAPAYGRDDSIRATFQYFSSFEQDAKDFAAFAETKLPMSVLVLTGEKASGTFLIDQARLVATNVRGVVVKGAGHWLMEEAPQQVLPELVTFITGTPGVESEATQQRLTLTISRTGRSLVRAPARRASRVSRRRC
jgi:hypothetical protein